jgi:hypothetical protein
MPRRLKMKTQELGDLELYLIYQYGGRWEEEWAPLQSEKIAQLLTEVSQELIDHALIGLTSPLVKALGIPPIGALRKLPDSRCYRRTLCPFYHKMTCKPTHPKLNWCFEPEGIEDPIARNLGSDLVKLWRESVYVLVVKHES